MPLCFKKIFRIAKFARPDDTEYYDCTVTGGRLGGLVKMPCI